MSVKLVVEDGMELVLGAFREISIIECVYGQVVLHADLNLGKNMRIGIERRISDTVASTGYSYLANGIIEFMNKTKPSPKHVDGLSTVELSDSLLKKLLRTHIMNQEKRFSSSSKSMRNLLRMLSNYASEMALNVVETTWRDLIVDTVEEECSKFFNSTETVHFSDLGYRTDELLDNLMQLLNELRYVSKMDMSSISSCSMSAEFAFQAAFKRYSNALLYECVMNLLWCTL